MTRQHHLSTCITRLSSLSFFFPTPIFYLRTILIILIIFPSLFLCIHGHILLAAIEVFFLFSSPALSLCRFLHKDFPLMDRVTLLLYLRTLTASGHTFHLITPLLDLPPLPQLNFQFHPLPSFSPLPCPPVPSPTSTTTSINFLLLSPYKNAPVLFSEALPDSH